MPTRYSSRNGLAIGVAVALPCGGPLCGPAPTQPDPDPPEGDPPDPDPTP